MRLLSCFLFLFLLVAIAVGQNTYTVTLQDDRATNGTITLTCTNQNSVTVWGPQVYSYSAALSASELNDAVKIKTGVCVQKSESVMTHSAVAPTGTHGSSMHDSTVPTSTDSRFSDARAPLAHSKALITDFAHTHPESDVTNLTTDLAAKSVNIAKGTATFATTAIAAGACSANATISGTQTAILATDSATAAYQGTITSTDGTLVVNVSIAAGSITILRCNPTAASKTPTAKVMNWQVTR